MPQFANAYGQFSDDGREYLITRPDTPMPWINVISNGDYGLTISQAGGGYSWRGHAGLNRITRWEQDLIRDEWGRFLYLRDAESGAFWSLGHQPCGGHERYEARHGMGYSTLTARRDGIASELTYTVPLGDPCELWLVRLRNEGDRPRRLQLFSYFEWGLGAAPDSHREFHRTFIETAADEASGTLLATKLLWELPGQKGPHWNRSWPYVAFHSASLPPAGFDCDKAAFLGRHGRLAAPRALQEGRSWQTAGRGLDAIGSLQLELELAPGAERELVFTLGAADDREAALALAERYRDPAAAHRALDEVRRFWGELCDALQVETPDPAFNLMAGGWLQYQAISGRLWGRSAYYQTGGAYGYRDQLQDSLTWLLLGRPERTLDQIRLHAAHQHQDGTALHWWHPLAESGLPSRYSDDLLWLPFVTLAYINETGDRTCLDEQLPFFDGGAASLREHCLRAFALALERRSSRGLPLILEADWNDGLNAVGAAGRGESVWMAHFLYGLLRGWAAAGLVDETTAARFTAEAEALREATERHAWDGAWYWRATTDDGATLGSANCEEGQIFLNAQTWAVLSGLASEERARTAMASARERLYTRYGPLLLAPAYAHPDPAIGYLSRYAPGTRENGGVYSHAACWAILAERRMGGAEAAYQLWRSFCPVLRGAEPDEYRAEPYVMPGNVDGPLSSLPGRGGWTWYTGSAGWNLRAMIEGVLGVVAEDGGLRVAGDLPEGWERFRLQRQYRGATYEILVRRAAPGEQPGRSMDGSPFQGELLPLAPPGATVAVEIVV